MQEWYLMTSNTRPNLTGGFENDTYLNYKEDVLVEVLETDIASTIVLYNSDLSKSIATKSIVQNNVADSQDKSTERQCLLQIGVSKDYIYAFFDNHYWLMISYVGNNGMYEKVIVKQCNYTLLFQLPIDYSIVSVPCITSDKTFSIDESKTIALGANKQSILLPRNVDTLTLKTDRRVYIDIRNETPYKLLDPNTTSYNYGEKGLIYIIANQDTAQNTSEYKDRPDLGICNYHEPVVIPPTPVGSTYSEIKTSGDLLIGSTRARTLTVTCYNADKTVNTSAVIICSFVYPTGYESLFTIEYPTNRTATIMCGSTDDYDKLIGKVVKVSVSDGSGGFVGNLDLKIKMT